MPDKESFLVNAAKYYRAESHQDAAWRGLEASLQPEVLNAFKVAYRGSEGPPKITKTDEFPLDVPYFYQRDSKTGHGERMCFSSSMAMALDYIDNYRIEGDDDWYLQHVFRFGDSVDSSAQVKAAQSLGYKAEFRMDGTQSHLEKLLNDGIPVPIGILHHGPIEKPSGGGHWICLIGYDDTHFMVNDPFGELDLLNGGYPLAGPLDGVNVRYSKKNLMKRWLIASKCDGWFVDLRGN